MSDTPRTDQLYYEFKGSPLGYCLGEMCNHAEILERELNAYKLTAAEQSRVHSEQHNRITQLEAANAELRAKLDAIYDAEPVACVDATQLETMQRTDNYTELKPADFKMPTDVLLIIKPTSED